MTIVKSKELEFLEKDIYILETTKDYIICNNGYEGIYILNYDLKLLHSVELLAIVCQQFFKKYNEREILIFSDDDDEQIFIIYNFDTLQTKKIKFPYSLRFFPIYYWKNNEIVLIDYQLNPYLLNTKTLSYRLTTTANLKKNFPSFFQTYEIAKKFNVKEFYPNIGRFTFFDERNNTIGTFDFKDNSIKTVKISYNEENIYEKPYTIGFRNETFLVSAESCLQIIKNNKCIVVQEEDQEFSSAKFLNNKSNSLVSVSFDIKNPDSTKISKFSIAP